MDIVEEMRRLLDERGIKYKERDYQAHVEFCIDYAEECGDYLRSIYAMGNSVSVETCYLTPEQAIELIREPTCHDTVDTPEYRDKTRFECSVCGYEYNATGGYGCDFGDEPWFSYCPNCGRRVVE